MQILKKDHEIPTRAATAPAMCERGAAAAAQVPGPSFGSHLSCRTDPTTKTGYTYYIPFGEGIAAHRGFLKGEQFRTHIWYLGDDQKTTQTEKT